MFQHTNRRMLIKESLCHQCTGEYPNSQHSISRALDMLRDYVRTLGFRPRYIESTLRMRTYLLGSNYPTNNSTSHLMLIMELLSS